MKKLLTVTAALLLATGFLATSASAEGLLGKRYLSLALGNITPGDGTDRDMDDAVMQIGAKGNFPIFKNLDAFVGLNYTQLKGKFEMQTTNSTKTFKTVEAGVAYNFMPEQPFNPFVQAAVGYAERKRADVPEGTGFPNEEAGNGTEKDVSVALTGGIDIPFAEQFALTPSFAYRRLGETDDFIAAVDVTGWFNKIIFAGLGTSYSINNSDFGYLWSVGFAF